MFNFFKKVPEVPSSPFVVGDLCMIITDGYIKPEYRGIECTILTGLHQTTNDEGITEWMHDVEVAGCLSSRQGPPSCFRKLPPPEELSTWDECVWKPKVLERIE